MIILYGFGANFGLPEASPYVTKTEVQLQMAGLAYRKVPASIDTSPKGQLPWIDDDGEKVADSTFIRMHIERKYGFDFDASLSPRERAQAWAFERMIENHFGWTVGYGRWLMPENFDKGPAHFFDGAPDAVRPQLIEDVKARVAGAMRAVGVGRHTPDEIVELGVRSLLALSEQLGDKPYLMSSRPSGVDATAFAMLAGLLTPFFDSPLRRQAEAFLNLSAYVDRMMGRHYPDHRWAAQRAPELMSA